MNPFAERDPDGDRSGVSAYMQYMTLGVQYAFGIGLTTFAGHWIDGKYDVGPWGTLLGATFGFIGSTVWLYQAVYSPQRSSNRSSSNRSSGDE